MIIALVPKKLVSLQRMPLQEKRSHLKRQKRVLHSEWLQCSSNLLAVAQLGPIFGNMISALHIAQWREVTNIRSMIAAQLNANIVSQSGSLRAHTFWLDYSPTTVQAKHVSSCLSRSRRENKNLLPIWKSKIGKRSLQFMFSHSYEKLRFAKSNSLFKSFLFIQVLSS